MARMLMQSRNCLFAILMLAACLTKFAADIYAPSLPAIAADLKTPINHVQWSMSVYMLGVALSQLIYGPLSEGLGRKPPMVIGLIIILIGSIICMNSRSIDSLIAGRFVQGCGAGAGASLWRPVFRDTFTGSELAKSSSYLVIFVMFFIPGASLLGGYLEEFFGWSASFIFIAIYSLIALICIVLKFNETNKNYHISKLNINYIVNNYLRLLKNPVFMGTTCSIFLCYGASFTWFVTGPVLLIQKIGIKPSTFGWLTFCASGVAYALAGYLNGKFVERLGMQYMMRFGWGIMITAGLAMMASYLIVGINTWAIMLPMALFYFGSTFIWPNAFAIAFTPFGDIAGYAGALYGFMQICGAAIIAGIVSYLPEDSPLVFSIIIIVSSISAWLIYEVFVKD